MDTKKKKVVLVDKNRFVRLVRNYHKSLHMVNLLSYICQQYRAELVLTLEEICELLPVTEEKVIAERDRGYVRFSCRNGIIFYRIGDILRIVNNQEHERLQKRVEEFSVILEKVE